jgi:crotonobetainyl-CoA:carnitine CoA-transferase CaiB-like acyl-CoA transferase
VRRIERFFRTKTRTELYDGARARHIILFPVAELSDMQQDRQMRERSFFVDMADGQGRSARFPGPLFRLAGGAAAEAEPAPSPPPSPAQHTASVLRELAGVDAAQFEELRAQGTVA